MNEEEMKNQIDYIIEVVTEGNDYTLRYYDIQCIMRLLDLYKQEKEKNKEYEKQLDLDYVDKNYISKDKIMELLKKYKLEYVQHFTPETSYFNFIKEIILLLEEK